jgi:hypothetical protein
LQHDCKCRAHDVSDNACSSCHPVDLTTSPVPTTE